MSKKKGIVADRENVKRDLADALGWDLEAKESGETTKGGFMLMGPGVYYFLGGTMSGKSTTIRDLSLQRDELIAFQHADGEIRRGVDEVVYFTSSDFDAVVHDPLEWSGVVFEPNFPRPTTWMH